MRLLHKAELLNGEIFTTLKEAQIVIENWRNHYNKQRPHSSLGYHRLRREPGSLSDVAEL